MSRLIYANLLTEINIHIWKPVKTKYKKISLLAGKISEVNFQSKIDKGWNASFDYCDTISKLILKKKKNC